LCNGSCECKPGLTDCNGQCVDTDSDPDNCGSCGNGCPGSCGGGECVDNCDGFPDSCDGACTNTENDPLNCGDCGEVCNSDEICSNGNCNEYAPTDCDACPCDTCDNGGNCCDVVDYGIVCVFDGGCP